MARLAQALVVSFVLSAAGLAAALWLIEAETEALAALRLTSPDTLLACLACLGATAVCATWRLQLIGLQLGCPLSAGAGLRGHFIATFGAAITPSSSGGMPLLVASLQSDGVPAARAWAAATACLVADLGFHSWMVPVSLAWLIGTGVIPVDPAWLTLGVGAALSPLLLALALWFRLGWLRPLLGGLLRGPLARWRDPALASLDPFLAGCALLRAASARRLALIGLLTAGSWCWTFAVLYLLARSQGVALDLATAQAIQSVYSVFASAAPTPGASGASEVTIAWVLEPRGAAANVAAVILSWRLLVYYSNFVTGPAFGGLALVRCLDQPGASGPTTARR